MRPKNTIRRASPENWPGEGLAEQPERAMEKTFSAFWLLSASKSYPITAPPLTKTGGAEEIGLKPFI